VGGNWVSGIKNLPVGDGIVGMEKTKIKTYFTTHNVWLFFLAPADFIQQNKG